ncbi:SGNH/GDSL hydrolase family protein [Costertonia aggregata]|uniref:G-D-S-L family lipolytic protein n=1 Tax=Costertonia aggregata TaxID=343403 RepID=A0A7H9AQA7_9FLAO|nr:G-D-S-L family lipolytic protein [Costertonia aggregata]QLG45593.1 G-D-S-L family lipolytic protein [Costertonia aggregata]
MKNYKYIFLASLLIAFTACNDIEDVLPFPAEVPEDLPTLTAGSADFSNYVSLGASFTAGFSDGALFRASQENSFPKLLSDQFALAGGGSFTQPLMEDNTGAFLGVPTSQIGYRLIFNGSGPQRLNEFFAAQGAPAPNPTTNPTTNLGSTFNNTGVPGAKSYHLTFPGYAAANPYYARFATSLTATMLGDAAAQNPSFFTLSEIGGNDVLSYATSGGVGVDRTGNPDATQYSQLDITDPGLFGQVFQGVISQLTANGANGAVANLPNITDLPFFTTVPNNALVIDAATAANLTGFFQAVTGIFTQSLIQQGVPPANAQALASQYAITFEEGANRFLIDVPVSETNPLGFRQMTEDELLLLTIDRTALAQGYGSVVLTPDVLQVLGLLRAGGTPSPEQAGLVLAAISGIDDKDALDSDELLSIKNATDAYNTTIESVANSAGLAFVDLKSVLEQAKTSGITTGDYTLTANLVTGGLVSLDGIHLTSRGYAVMANEFLKAIDATYGSNFEASGNLLDVGDYPTNYSPTLQ